MSPAFRSVSPAARHLVRQLLEKDPHKRIDAREVLTHEWMASMIPGRPPVPAPGPAGSASAAAASPSGNPPAYQHAVGAGVGARGPSGGGPQAGPSAPRSNSAATSVATGTGTCPRTANPETGHPRNRVGDQVISARIFYMPEDGPSRARLQGFLNAFKRLEEAYQQVNIAHGVPSVPHPVRIRHCRGP